PRHHRGRSDGPAPSHRRDLPSLRRLASRGRGVAGSALVLPEHRGMLDGIEHVDSFVFNPHKWMFTNFDCSAHYVRDPDALVRTLEILPEFLKTRERSQVIDYRDWSVPLGRRFRALKLWFVLRAYGVRGIQAAIAAHIE